MFSIFTNIDGFSCDFDTIRFFDQKKLSGKFGGELLISIKGDDAIGNIISECGHFYLRDFMFNLGRISRNIENEKKFSLAFDEHDLHEVSNDTDILNFKSNNKEKEINKHLFIFTLKVIISEINIFLNRSKNNRYKNYFMVKNMEYIVKY